MEKRRECWFTKKQATHIGDHRALLIESDAIGRYELSSGMVSLRATELESFDGQTPRPTQAKANCARKAVEVNRNLNSWVLWASKDEYTEYQDKYENNDNVVICCYEDTCNESVDHSAKPDWLLESIVAKLAEDRAYSAFSITDRDKAWARIPDDEELVEVVRYLLDEKLIKYNNTKIIDEKSVMTISFLMTVKGWGHISKKNFYRNTNKVFIAIQFDWAEGNSSEVIEEIKLACKDCGYEANIVSQNHTDYITNKILSEIKDSKFVVSEFTYNNRGVYFESGYARGLGKPVFHLVKKDYADGDNKEGKKIHFDIQHIMYRMWNDPAELRQILSEWIRVTVGEYQK